MADPAQSVILDPPWLERGAGKSKRGADRHYDLLKTKDIPDVIRASPLWQVDKNHGASVWCWATANFLGDAIWVLGELGLKYVTNVVWVKGTIWRECMFCGASEKDDLDCLDCKEPYDGVWNTRVAPQAPGLGQRVRMCHEHLLYARLGRVPVPEPADRLPSVIYAPRRKHSEKPDEAYELIERHDPPGRRVELFARRERAGWESWGKELAA